MDRIQVPGLIKEFSRLLGVTAKEFIELTIEFTLPQMVIKQNRPLIERIASEVFQIDMSVLCVKEIHHILFAVYLLESSDVGQAIKFLIGLVNDKAAVTLNSLIKSDALNLVRKLATELGDPLDSRRARADMVSQVTYVFVVTTLQTMLEKPTLREPSLRAWFTLIKTLGVSNIGPILSQVTAVLLKQYPEYSANERSILLDICSFLFIQNGKSLQIYFYTLCPFPELEEFEAIRQSLDRLRSSLSVVDRLKAILKGVSNENPDVTEGSLKELKLVLLRHETFLQSKILAEALSQPIIEMISCLLETCRRYNGSRPDIQLSCCECLGIIGAADPARISLEFPTNKDPTLDTFASFESTVKFACRLIEKQLAPAFKSAQSTKAQDHISFAIQEILRLCGFTPEIVEQSNSRALSDGTAKKSPLVDMWNAFPRTVIDIIQPLLTSQYRSTTIITKPEVYPIYLRKAGFKEWLQAWCVDLLLKVDSLEARKLFSVCKSVIEQNINVAQHLLPHIVLQILTTGPPQYVTEVHQELLAVLKSGSLGNGNISDFSQQLSRQTIFSLVDHLTLWIRLRRQSNARKRVIKARRSGKVVNDDDLDDEDIQCQKVEAVLVKIPQDLMANASYRSKAYARALMHFEQHVRGERKTRSELDMQQLYEHLQRIYSHLDEPDGMDGIASLILSPSLEQQTLEHDPDKLSLHTGLINCLKNLGHFESMLSHINGIISNHKDWEPILRSYSIEACWRLGSWSTLENIVALPHEQNFEVRIAKLLLAARERNSSTFYKLLKETREELTTPLSAASMESYLRGYDIILKLHMLHEVERAFNFSQSKEPVDDLLKAWDSRLKICVSSLKVREPILNLRRILLNDLGSQFSIISMEKRNLEIESGRIWLQTANAMRKAGHLDPAYSAILHAAELNVPDVVIEKAKWLLEKGQSYKAIQELQFRSRKGKAIVEGVPATLRKTVTDISRSGSDVFTTAQDNQLDMKSASFIEAKSLVMLARKMDENGIGSLQSIVTLYQAAIELQPDWEKGHFLLGRFYDKLLESEKYTPTLKRTTLTVANAHYQICKHYGRALTHGTRYIYQTLPRLLTLWLDTGTQQSKRSENTEITNTFNQINKSIGKLVEKIPAYHWMTALPQLISRICHINRHVQPQLETIILRALVAYPLQTLWQLVSVSKSRFKTRAQRCTQIFDKAKLLQIDQSSGKKENSLRNLVIDAQKMTDELLYLCNFQIKGKETLLHMAKQFPSLKLLAPSAMILPLQSTMTVTLPLDNSTLSSHNPFPNEAPTFKKFHDDIEIMNSLQKPRKIGVHGSNGRRYNFLLKPKDDLRKDNRLMEFNALINRLLKKDPESRRRNLHVRTYAVVPLNEECGIIEWVENTAGLRNILVKNYKTKNIFSTMSMVGYIVGLGDRHGENILLDELAGACVHVDLNCLFEKGATFEKPEVVPFRLTQNMVDAFGVSGTEGVFKKACEHSLRVLRANRESLVAVLETFIHDPLCEWSRKSNVKGHLKDTIGEIENEEAMKHLKTIDSKLKGVTPKTGFQLGVEGQVQELISEATDPKNLAVMYIGMLALNKELFLRSFPLTALRIPASACSLAMKNLGTSLFDVPRLRSIVEDPNAALSNGQAATRLILLNPSIHVSNFESLPSEVKDFAQSVQAELAQYTLDLGYDYWTTDQILRSILPEELEVPGSFEIIGHIVHLNLRDQYLPFKKIIGEVLLDKNKYIRTVVNKTDSIDHTFRFFKMELLAGEDDMIAEVKESNCRFKVDFSAVYWNSRLQGEHDRIVQGFTKDDLVCDVFGGVGPFAVPAAKNVGCLVFCNDLNPVSYNYLIENTQINKVGHLLRPYNMDGREFIKSSLADLNNESVIQELVSKIPPPKEIRPKKKEPDGALAKGPAQAPRPKYSEPGFKLFNHYVMNLPGTAIEFLDSFWGLLYSYRDKISIDQAMPIIHCHCFAHKEDDTEDDVIKRVESFLGAKVGDNLIKIYKVRGVSPKKEMLCVTFRLPSEVAFGDPKTDPKR
ncbi:hypothetical protein HDU97_010236 [Phlyctochytrium planicorne]|nr:hypothetical protein HDU97_010236 [Phlyctochytrium planicorne]